MLRKAAKSNIIIFIFIIFYIKTGIMEIKMRTKAKKKLLLVTAAFFTGFFGCDDKTFLCDDRSGG